MADVQLHPILGVPQAAMPKHVAIIMDGNGRWAQQQGLPRLKGHQSGSKAVRYVMVEGANLGLECLTLYSFSTENWNRPKVEVDGLMQLYKQYLIEERPTIMENNIKVRHIGFRDRMPDFVIKELDETIELSKNNTGMELCLALDYSGRTEILRAVKDIASKCKSGEIEIDAIDEQLISDSLDTKGLPDPDLLVRTSGERRVSNYLLWQISYAEFYVTDVHWPDFTVEVLHEAIKDYCSRNRRFGGIGSNKK
ncbi:MAG: isoprenyl transferase [Phycisphaerae bacterium]|nr:isoprenyl transferase [Phycisphaerae bacterium]